MNCAAQHELWVSQLKVLKEECARLSETEPRNVLEHFFLQAAETELVNELEHVKKKTKKMICYALEHLESITGSYRQRAAAVLKQFMDQSIIHHINLSDLRNIAVFEIYKHCAITVDTYFERYSSPPGNAAQNTVYNQMAHGHAIATAENTVLLGTILMYMQILKRVFVVFDAVFNDIETSKLTLNWIGAMWACHIDEKKLGDLVWELFLDVCVYENL